MDSRISSSFFISVQLEKVQENIVKQKKTVYTLLVFTWSIDNLFTWEWFVENCIFIVN